MQNFKQYGRWAFGTHVTGMILICLLPTISFWDMQLYRSITREDRGVEYLTAFFLLVSAILVVRRLCRYWNTTTFRQKLGLGLMGWFFFVGFGEEISWGQRIFELHTPEFFKAYNLQNETNIHNLKIKGIKLNKWVFTYGAMLVFLIYFSLPFLIKRSERFKKYVDMYGILIPNSGTSVLFLIATIILNTYNVPKVSELWELSFASTMVTICLTKK